MKKKGFFIMNAPTAVFMNALTAASVDQFREPDNAVTFAQALCRSANVSRHVQAFLQRSECCQKRHNVLKHSRTGWLFRKWPNITAHLAKHQAISATFCRFPERL